MNNLHAVSAIVALQMEIIAHLWQRLQLFTPSHMPSYTEGEGYAIKARTAAALATETYRDEKDRWTYVRWLGEYISELSHLVQRCTTDEKLADLNETDNADNDDALYNVEEILFGR